VFYRSKDNINGDMIVAIPGATKEIHVKENWGAILALLPMLIHIR